MFNELLNLYNKNSSKTPLEDFTTEALVGILNLEEDIKQDFIKSVLKLEEDTYQIKTQEKFPLEGEADCIPDYVLCGENNICFVENKVNSPEGYEQLERYSKVLETRKEKNKKLVYCTKYADPKERKDHHFLHIRWYQIAKFLKNYQDRSIVKAFIQFLKKQKMAQELIITAQDFIVFENIQKTMSLVSEYLNGVKTDFEKKFNKVSDGISLPQLRDHNHFIYYYKPILGNEKQYSIIGYGFSFKESEPTIFAQIFVSNNSNQYEKFSEKIKDIDKQQYKYLVAIQEQIGHHLIASTNLSDYMYKDDAIVKVSNWFENAFDDLEKFITDTSDLSWNIKIKA